MTTLRLTFDIEMSSNILERGALLTSANAAAEAFARAMDGHKVKHTAEEIAEPKKRGIPAGLACAGPPPLPYPPPDKALAALAEVSRNPIPMLAEPPPPPPLSQSGTASDSGAGGMRVGGAAR